MSKIDVEEALTFGAREEMILPAELADRYTRFFEPPPTPGSAERALRPIQRLTGEWKRNTLFWGLADFFFRQVLGDLPNLLRSNPQALFDPAALLGAKSPLTGKRRPISPLARAVRNIILGVPDAHSLAAAVGGRHYVSDRDVRKVLHHFMDEVDQQIRERRAPGFLAVDELFYARERFGTPSPDENEKMQEILGEADPLDREAIMRYWADRTAMGDIRRRFESMSQEEKWRVFELLKDSFERDALIYYLNLGQNIFEDAKGAMLFDPRTDSGDSTLLPMPPERDPAVSPADVFRQLQGGGLILRCLRGL